MNGEPAYLVVTVKELVARALYNEPEVLILDEATSALDSKTELKVIKAIEELYNNKTIIIITHRMTAIKNCENVIQLGKWDN